MAAILGAVIAVDAETGSERWRFATDSYAELWTPAVVGDTLFVGTSDGSIYAVDTTSGMERWHTNVGIMPPSSSCSSKMVTPWPRRRSW